MYKELLAIRGGQYWPKTVRNGDKYDSILTVNDGNYVLFECPYFNTDLSIKYKSGGILAEGRCGWICVNTKKLGKSLCLFNEKYFDKINSVDDLSEERLILPSLIPNPNHNGKMDVSEVFIHNGAYLRDNSKACQTLYPDYYPEFIGLFQINDKGFYNLERDPLWIPPKIYNQNIYTGKVK